MCGIAVLLERYTHSHMSRYYLLVLGPCRPPTHLKPILYITITNIMLCRTLLTSSAGLEHAKELVSAYKQGEIQNMTPELWQAKKTIDSTIHPGMMI